jgi:hypothetical protein
MQAHRWKVQDDMPCREQVSLRSVYAVLALRRKVVDPGIQRLV